MPPVPYEYRKPILRASLRRHTSKNSVGPDAPASASPSKYPRGDLFWPTEALMNLHNCSNSGKMNHVYPIGLI